METMKYKDFLGSVEVSIPDNCVYGKVLYINDLVTYEADSPKELKKAFKDSVDEYIETCKEIGIEPHKSYNGVFNVRIEPDLHRSLAQNAIQRNKKLNTAVKEAIEKYLQEPLRSNEVHNNYYVSVMESSIDKFLPKSVTRKQDIIQFDRKVC